MRPRLLLSHGCLILTLAGTAAAGDPPWVARATGGMVASDSPEASEIGAAVLRSGGNAFDAAIATSFALAVARPHSTGIGGGGFLLAYSAKDKRFTALDFRECAPEAAMPRRYAELRKHGRYGTRPAMYGGSAVGVPGQVAGLGEIHRRFATRPWAELVAPGAALARAGFTLDANWKEARDEALSEMDGEREVYQVGFRLHRVLTPVPELGTRLPSPKLAEALELLAREGPRAFYEGPIADDVLDAIKDTGGEMTRDDLLAYAVLEREPVRFRYGDYELVGMPPPASGGVWMAEMLNILDAKQYEQLRSAAPGDARQVLIEAMKHAFADRARWMGDPDQTPIPLERLTSPTYAGALAERIFTASVLKSHMGYGSTEPAIAPATQPDDRGTSHFSVVDREGNIVALTETINGRVGSYVLTEKFNILLNNELDDFVTEKGKANQFGLIESETNLIRPGKRPLSSMSPTIIFKQGRPVAVLGGSGGPRILSATLQVALGLMRGDDPAEAVAAPRLHHQWTPDAISFDKTPPPDVVADLQARGQSIAPGTRYAVVQAIAIQPDGTLVGLSDPRKGGRPAGVP